MPLPLANLGPWFGNTINTIVSPFYTLFSNHATYCFTARTNVRKHQRDARTLDGNRWRVQDWIENGCRNGLIATEDAKLWLQSVNGAISEEAANRLRYETRWCFLGSLNCWGNYKISKKAAEKLEDVNAYITSTPLADNVTREPPPPPVVNMPIQPVQLTASRHAIFDYALQVTKDDSDTAVGVIGIWGTDRDERTHLLEKINNSFLGECLFEYVIFVTASRGCAVQNIQAQIITRLCLNQHADVITQATRISELLGKKSFLVMIDDLYQDVDLSAVGIPYPLGVVKFEEGSKQLKRKVVITSRSQDVCHLMNVNKEIEVPDLGEEEARQLFKQNFGAEDLYSIPRIGALANSLVGELKGLPSELIRLGKLMQGERGARRWESVLHAVKKSNLTDDSLSSAEKIVRNLENATKDLLAKRNDVRMEIKDAERRNKTPTNVVNRWLEKVGIITGNAEIFSVDSMLIKKDVILEAAEKIQEVLECLSNCPSTIVVDSMPSPVQEMPGPSMSAEDPNLQEALHFIQDDPVGMIGIWGPGGVGKTYLLNNINNTFHGDVVFDNVIYVTASKGCSVEKIQDHIVRKLKLTKDDNVDSQRSIIYDFLRERSFLILLDDLWDRIDMQAVGIPYPLGSANQIRRKMVLTTRSRKVCGQMEVRKEFKVVCLQEDDAWQLFQDKVGHETMSYSPHIEILAKELVKEMKGLPLALVTTGRAMYGKVHTAEWDYAIRHMKRSCCDNDDPLDMERVVFNQVKFSFDSLQNKTLRDCFLTCALWPEDQEIPEVELARCWIGLGLVDELDIQSSYTKAYSLMDDLSAACLLDGCGKFSDSVKMHDVVRDMALWISCGCSENNGKWFVRAEFGPNENFSIPWSQVEYVSLVHNSLLNLPFVGSNPCHVRMLCLGNNMLRGITIAEEINKFISLTYLDLHFNKLMVIPEELCSLINLKHLDLSCNMDIHEVPHCFRNLINLKFLYLQSTGIQRISEGVISSLQALQVIDFRTTLNTVFEDLPRLLQELGTLPHLKSVGMNAMHFSQCELLFMRENGNLPIRYLNMWGLVTHTLYFSNILSHDFARRTLYELMIGMCNMDQIIVRHNLEGARCWFSTLNELYLVQLSDLKEITWIETSPASLFPRLAFLMVESCEKLNHLSWAMYLPFLKQLIISFCPSMQQAFMRHPGDNNCNAQDRSKTFPSLKYLDITHGKTLVSIGGPDVTFPSLERLMLEACPKLKSLPFKSDNLPRKLQVLETSVKCLEELELEEGVKNFLQPKLKFVD